MDMRKSCLYLVSVCGMVEMYRLILRRPFAFADTPHIQFYCYLCAASCVVSVAAKTIIVYAFVHWRALNVRPAT